MIHFGSRSICDELTSYACARFKNIHRMSDATTKLATASLEFAKALVWPLALLWVLHRFRTQLSDLLARVGSVKVAGSEWVFQEPLRKATESVVTTSSAVEWKVGADGFLNVISLHAIVSDSKLLEMGESVRGELLLFQTPTQRTWLIATSRRIFVLLDDDATREEKRVIQTSFDRARTLPLRFGKSEGEGIVKFRAEQTWWYYSTHLFPSTDSLNTSVRRLI
jgi:hypothetical protein